MHTHALTTYGPAILSLAKIDANDVVIGCPLAPLRFCWKRVVVALCRVCSSITSPALSVFGSLPAHPRGSKDPKNPGYFVLQITLGS
jgi:hypothetical protein